MKLDWRDVLNPNHNWRGTISNFFNDVVKPSGYPYFAWNGRVYKVVKEDDSGFALFSKSYTYVETEFTDEVVGFIK